MTSRTTLSSLLGALLLAAASPAAASKRIVRPTDPAQELTFLRNACASPNASACAEELDAAANLAAHRLVELAQDRPELAFPLAEQAADAGFPALRAAAAEAVAQPFASASATPLLGELLDDPVPAVRTAAARALFSSNDERALRLARRASSRDDSGTGQEPSTRADAEVAAASSGVTLPSDAVFLFFDSDASAGRLSYSTAQAPAQVLAALAKKGRGPFTPEQFRQEVEGEDEEMEDEMELEDGEMPSPEQMAKMMQMAEKMMTEMNKNPNATPEQQAMAMARAAGVVLLDANLADDYEDAELFGDPKLVIVQRPDGSDAAVAVYLDRALGRTGITVHRGLSGGG